MSGMMTTTSPADVTARQQLFFNKKLLKTVQENLRMAQFAMPGELSKNQGSKTVRFFRRKRADSSNVIELAEGVPPTNYRQIEYESVDVTLKQFGEIAKISDVQSDIDIFNLVSDAITAMGEDAALQADELIRDVVMTGLLDSDTLGSERFASVTSTGDSSTDFGTFHGKQASAAKATRAEFLACATRLKSKANLAPKIKGAYVALVPAEVVHDLRQDPTIEAAFTRSAIDRFFRDELGMLDGIRYIEHSNPWREGSTYGTYDETGGNFTSLVFGAEAFGAPKLSGSASPWMPKVSVISGADKADPLNQFTLAGWKTFWNSLLLNPRFIVALRTKSTFA